MMQIKKQLVSKAKANKVTYDGTNKKKYIVIHETANTSKGADAQAHANLQSNGNSRKASWHYQVDDKQVIQSFSDDTQCWHAGNKYYNQNSIGIEICVNSDGNFKKAVDNAVKLTKHLMDKYNIPASNVIQHNKASGKDCPRYLRSGEKGVTWSQFKAKLSGKTSSKPKPSKMDKKPSSTQKSTYKGNSIVEYLQSIGQPSSFAHRRKLAKQHGIKSYTGTASQNIQLLRILRDGAKVTPSKPKKTVKQMADEVIAGKHGSGHANRRKSLGISASEYAKVRAEVNRRLTGKAPKKTVKKTSKSISQMATEVIRGDHGTGHAKRRKSLGVDKATYEKVRREVNRRLK